MGRYIKDSFSSLQKKSSRSGNRAQAPPRPALTVGNSSYIFFLSHLCCRGPHNSIGARRYTLFVDSTFFDFPSSTRLWLGGARINGFSRFRLTSERCGGLERLSGGLTDTKSRKIYKMPETCPNMSSERLQNPGNDHREV